MVEWLIEGDPSIRWQAMRDLLGRAPRDERLADALELVRAKRQPDGRWLLAAGYPGRTHFEMEKAGQPSRWNTIRALRVLKWASLATDHSFTVAVQC